MRALPVYSLSVRWALVCVLVALLLLTLCLMRCRESIRSNASRMRGSYERYGPREETRGLLPNRLTPAERVAQYLQPSY